MFRLFRSRLTEIRKTSWGQPTKSVSGRRGDRRLIIEGLERRELFAQLVWAAGPALPEARAGAAAIAAGGSVLLAGGGTTTVNQWNPGSNVWGQATAIDMPRVSAGFASSGSGYLVYGGVNGTAVLDESLGYDPWNIDNTQDGSVMPTPTADFAYASDDNHMAYAIGGRTDQVGGLSRVLRYNSSTATWQTVSSLPISLIGAAAVNDASGHLLVFGGVDAAGHASSRVFQYSVASDTWSTLNDMPVAEHNGAAVLASNGRVYVIGGQSDTATLATVQSYDPSLGSWTMETSLPQPLSHLAAATDSAGHIVVMGGFDTNHVAVKAVSVSQVLNAPDAPPTFTSTAPATVMVGANYVYNIQTVGNPQATYQLISAPSGMTIDALGTILWTPTLAQAGLNTVSVRATNVVGSANQTFTIRALTPAPTAPASLAVSNTTTTSATLTWSPSTDSVAVAGYRVYRVTHTGFHGITTVLTQVADVPTTTATISGLTAGTSYVYTVKAYNPSGNVSSASNSVTARTLSPIIYTGPSVVSGVARHPIVFTLSASANPSAFTYTNLTPTDGMTLNPTTGQVTWTPADSDLGANYFSFRIDHLLGSVTVEVNINVTANVPYSTFIAGPSAVVGVPYTAQFTQIADPFNTEPVSYSLVSAPASMTIDSATGQINWMPTLADLATAATVTVSISNYAGSTTNSATIVTAFASPAQQVAVSHISTNTAVVSWDAPANASEAIASYSITASYRVQSGRFLTTRTINYAATATDRSLLMTGLPVNKAINVSVRALDSTGRGSWAGVASFVTASQLPQLTISGGPFNYDGNPHPASATATTAAGAIVPGDVSFTYNGLNVPPVLPGTYTVVATFSSSDPTYGERSASGTLIVLPGIPTIAVANSSVDYDGQSHSVSATALGIDGSTPVPGSFTYTYNGSVAPPTTPGIYIVVASFTSADALYGSSTGAGTLTIRSLGPLAPIISVSHLSSSYDGTPHAALATAANSAGVAIPGQFKITYNGSTDVPVNAGLYTVLVEFVSNDSNYHNGQVTANMVIEKATPTADLGWEAYPGSAPVPVIAYDGQTHAATAIAYDLHGISLAGTFAFSYSASPINASSYVVTASFTSGDANYANTILTQTLTIEAAVPYVEIVFADPAVGYGSNYYYGIYDGHAWSAQATAFDLNSTSLAGAMFISYYAYDVNTNDYTTLLSNAPRNAGSYLVMSAFTSANANYADTVGYGWLQVDAATPQLNIGGTFNYDGLGHVATAQALGVDGVTPVAGSFTVLVNGSPTLPVNAGNYSVSVAFTSEDSNYTDAAGDGTLVINKVTPIFSNLTLNPVTVGTTTATVTGKLAAGTTYPSNGQVSITLNGATVTARVSATGTFSASLASAALTIGSYPVTFAYAGNTVGFNAAPTATASLVVTARAPVVTTNPAARTVTAGTTATFSAAASGNPTPTVLWQLSTDNGATFSTITGATGTALNVVTNNTMNGYRYRAVFSNSAGTATTTVAVLTVQYAPVVTTNPVSQTAAVGSTVRFTAAARSNPAATVQWQVSSNSGSTWTNIAGATSTTLSLTATASLRGYRYRAVFTNSIGAVTTTAATLTV